MSTAAARIFAWFALSAHQQNMRVEKWNEMRWILLYDGYDGDDDDDNIAV